MRFRRSFFRMVISAHLWRPGSLLKAPPSPQGHPVGAVRVVSLNWGRIHVSAVMVATRPFRGDDFLIGANIEHLADSGTRVHAGILLGQEPPPGATVLNRNRRSGGLSHTHLHTCRAQNCSLTRFVHEFPFLSVQKLYCSVW